jgi:hypothetical protein
MSPEIDSPLGGILDTEPCRIGLSPEYVHRIDRNGFPEIKDHPLGLPTLGLSGVGPGQVGIALPECGPVPVDYPGITVIVGLVEGIAATGKLVAVGNVNRVCGIGVTIRGPVALPVQGIAPSSPGIPMPCLHGKFRAESHGDRAQTRLKHLSDTLLGEHCCGISLPVTIEPCSKGLAGIKRSDHPISDLNAYLCRILLSVGTGTPCTQKEEKESRNHRSITLP